MAKRLTECSRKDFRKLFFIPYKFAQVNLLRLAGTYYDNLIIYYALLCILMILCTIKA
jgi:hypothetical protein